MVLFNARLLFEDQASMFESSLVRISAQHFISFAFAVSTFVESSEYWRQVQLGTQFFTSMTLK